MRVPRAGYNTAMARFTGKTESEAVVTAGRERVWDLLTDPDAVARLTPFLQRIEVEDDLWIWHMGNIPGLPVKFAPTFTERMRFTELQQRIPGISQRMLTRTVRQLERDGLVEREVFAEVPPRVEYALTDTGRTLIAPAVALAEWAIEQNPAIERSQDDYDARQG